MNLLTPFRARIWHMFSPGESLEQTIEKPPSPKTDPVHKIKRAKLERGADGRRRSLSPTIKHSPVESEVEVELSSEEEEAEEDLDESDSPLSDVDGDSEPDQPRFKKLKRSRNPSGDGDYEVEDEEEEEPKADITQEEKDEYGIGITIEPVEHATLEDPEYEGWSQDELDLYNRLNDRGIVPLLHTSWKLDFSTIPDVLFTDDRNEAYIKSEKGSDFRGIKALSSLLQAGVRMRDRSYIARQNPAPLLARLVRDYITWSIKDIGLDEKTTTPLMAVMAAPHTEAIQKTVTRMKTELQNLATRWQDIWADSQEPAPANHHTPSTLSALTEYFSPSTGSKRKRSDRSTPTPSEQGNSTSEDSPPAIPTLYGIVIARTIMAFVTYDAAGALKDQESKVRNLALFNWRDPGQDVWNALAVALMVMQARETLVHLQEAGLGIARGRKGSESSVDVDA